MPGEADFVEGIVAVFEGIGASRYFWTPYMILGAGGTYQLSLSGYAD